ncbi:hypothetical protein PHYC_03108 [Phycisphaerales bacterium]|nr:hypothetical protein PHYC_03108 [Phycisphaerales bacterium]
MGVSSTKTSVTLLLQVRDGDNAAAWAQFEDRYREMLLRFCRSLTPAVWETRWPWRWPRGIL